MDITLPRDLITLPRDLTVRGVRPDWPDVHLHDDYVGYLWDLLCSAHSTDMEALKATAARHKRRYGDSNWTMEFRGKKESEEPTREKEESCAIPVMASG